MSSQKNFLQVLTSNSFKSQTIKATLAALEDGAIGFFTNAGAIAATGAGRFVLRKGTEYFESPYIENFTGWVATKQAYAAFVAHTETVTLTAAVVAGTYYQLRVEMDIKGMTGKYIKESYHKAVTGDTVTTIAAALVARMNASFTREGNTALTISSALGVITVVNKLQTYDPGKKLGGAVPFSISIQQGPTADIQLGTVTVAGTSGIGRGAQVHAKEFFAWGNQDACRYNGWRNNFTPKVYADPTLTYDVYVINETTFQRTDNATVPVPVEIFIAFNTAGATPV